MYILTKNYYRLCQFIINSQDIRNLYKTNLLWHKINLSMKSIASIILLMCKYDPI